jgi:hypothetical protein
MTVKYSKFFTVTSAITLEPVTILVEYIKAEGFKGISVESLEGEYDSQEEFSEATKLIVDKRGLSDKIFNFLPLMLPDARKLVDTLNEALIASEEG